MGVTRRHFIKGAGWTIGSVLASAGYAFGLEPFSLRIQGYGLTPPRWPHDLRLTIAVLADIHACRPWMDADRVRAIARHANSLEPDVTVLLGDFTAGHPS